MGLRLLGAFLDSVGKDGGASIEVGRGSASNRGPVDTKLVKRIVACLDVRCGGCGLRCPESCVVSVFFFAFG